MKTQHTLGPWTNDTEHVTIEDQLAIIAEKSTTLDAWQAVGVDQDGECIAVVALCHSTNALLIAAAPELLEALKRIINSSVALPPSMVQQANRAISKATLKYKS